jgi:hypothetical protein
LQRDAPGPFSLVLTVLSSRGVRRTIPVLRELIGVVSKAATDTVYQVLQSSQGHLEAESVTATDGSCLLLELDLDAGDLVQLPTGFIKEFHYMGESGTVVTRRLVSYQ